jgi:hypothetical protein
MGRACSIIECILDIGREAEGKAGIKTKIYRWVDNIKMDLRLGWGGMDWIDLAQVRDQWRALVNTLMNFRVP